MLRTDGDGLLAALDDVRRDGGARIARALTDGAQQELLDAVAGAQYEPAERYAGRVEQDLESLAGGTEAALKLGTVRRLVEAYEALLRGVDLPQLADFAVVDVEVQRYRAGSRGITPHRDHLRYVRLVSVFSLGAPAEFRICRDRGGTPIRTYRLESGDLFLMRAPGFDGSDPARPLHTVFGPEDGVRYSIGLRMKRSG